MRITSFEWDEENTGHIARHGIHPEEAEEACGNDPFILKGREGLYLIYSQTESGRYLLVAARYRGRQILRPITARELTAAEKGLCRKNRRR